MSTANILVKDPTDILGDIGGKVQELMERFRSKWLPENPIIKQSLELLSSDNEKLSIDDCKGIIAKLVEHSNFLEKFAFLDQRTRQLNVNAFHAALKNIINDNIKAKEDGKDIEPTTVVVIDLNYLKALNNVSYGGCGDAAIEYLTKFVTERLRNDNSHPESDKRKSTTSSDQLFTRMSNGDEFAIIMKNCTPETAQKRIKPILESMARASVSKEAPCFASNKNGTKIILPVSAAFGCASLLDVPPSSGKFGKNREKDIEEIIDYTVKKAGDNEAENKKESKDYAEKHGGFPSIDDRQDAVKKITEILNVKFTKAEEAKIFELTNDPNDGKNVVEIYRQDADKNKELIQQSKQNSVPRILATGRHDLLNFGR